MPQFLEARIQGREDMRSCFCFWRRQEGESVPIVTVETTVNAPAEKVYELAKGVERFPEFMPEVESVKVLSREGSDTVTHWVGKIKEFNRTIEWTEQDHWFDDDMRCEFAQVKGDFAVYKGTWAFCADPAGTFVSLHLEYDYHVPLIGALLNKVIFNKMTQNCQNMLNALKAEAEKGAAA